MTQLIHPVPLSRRGEPPWQIATLFPNQGDWSEIEYLDLNRRSNRLIELSDGCVEVLPVPTKQHQKIVQFFYRSLFDFVTPGQLGEVIVAAYPLRLWEGKFREPDVLFARAAHAHWFSDDFATGADLVMEVLSEDRGRDLALKRGEYERAGTPEYWLVDPRDRRVTVLRLENGKDVVHGEFLEGDRATSLVLGGFSIEVAELFAQA
jgi:Uma2 family endonuclease